MVNNVSRGRGNVSRPNRARGNSARVSARNDRDSVAFQVNQRALEEIARVAINDVALAEARALEARTEADRLRALLLLASNNSQNANAAAAADTFQGNVLAREDDDVSLGEQFFDENSLWLPGTLDVALQAKWEKTAYTTLLDQQHQWTVHPMQTYVAGRAELINGKEPDFYIIPGIQTPFHWRELVASRAWEADRAPANANYFAGQPEQMAQANNVFVMFHVGQLAGGHYILLHYRRDARLGRIIQANPGEELAEELGDLTLLFNAVFGEISLLPPNSLTFREIEIAIDQQGVDAADFTNCGPLAVCALKHYIRFPLSDERPLRIRESRKTAIISLKNVLRDCFSKERILGINEENEAQLTVTKLLCYLDDADFLEAVA